jgi:outer membrane protein with beta-barrel domain
MRVMRAAILCVSILAMTAGAASAEGFFVPFVGFNYGGDSANCVSLTACNEKRVNWGASIGARSGILGFEEDISYAPSFFDTSVAGDNAVLTLMSSLMVIVPAGPIQPYALFGLGLIRPHMQFNRAGLALDQNTLGYDVGGGLNIFLSRSVGVRGDIRHMHTLQDVTLGVFGTTSLDFWRGSLGLALRF